MALSRAVTVATTATRLDSTGDTDGIAGSSFAAHNNSAVTVYVGGSDVTTANGFPVPAGTSLSDDELPPAGAYYGIVATGTAEVRVLESGV